MTENSSSRRPHREPDLRVRIKGQSQDGTVYRYLNLNAIHSHHACPPFETSQHGGARGGNVIYDHFTRTPYCNVIRMRSGAVGAHWTEDVSRLQPVLVVTPYRADANLITELLRGFASTIVTLWAQTPEAAIAMAAARSPRLVFVDQVPPPGDGLAFVRKLRRSDLTCREAWKCASSYRPNWPIPTTRPC